MYASNMDQVEESSYYFPNTDVEFFLNFTMEFTFVES